MINLITRQINQPQVSLVNQNNSNLRLNNLKQLNKDVFTPSFCGGEPFKLPLDDIERMGQKYLQEFVDAIDNTKKYSKLGEYMKAVTDSIQHAQDNFIAKKNTEALSQLHVNKPKTEIFDEKAFMKFVHDCSHESLGSYTTLHQLNIMHPILCPKEALPFKEQEIIANNSFKSIVNHANETTKRYQFFLDHNMDSETSTIGANKVFDLLIDAFKKQADDKNIKLVIYGKDILKKNSQSTYNDYKNYIIMSNFLGNAIKYSDPNSVIELGFKTAKKDNHLKFFIKDQGIGVLEEDMVNILKQKRGKNVGDRAGSGYGLYRTASLVNDAGGEIKITSPLYPNEPIHKGTMFECSIYSGINKKFPLTKAE